MPEENILTIRDFSLRYDNNIVLSGINLKIKKNKITAIIGPSGCGKSSLLRCFNRMNDFIDGVSTTGNILFRNNNIFCKKTNPIELRKQIGMVFQKPTAFPKSIYENIAYGLNIAGKTKKKEIDEIVHHSLKQVGLWGEVKDRLKDSANKLSGGQAQRLCIARTIAIEPQVILMDEPTSSLDPNSTKVTEKLIKNLQKKFTIIIVTHNMQQAMRVSNETAFLYLGKLIEFDKTKKVFKHPQEALTKKYITGKIG